VVCDRGEKQAIVSGRKSSTTVVGISFPFDGLAVGVTTIPLVMASVFILAELNCAAFLEVGGSGVDGGVRGGGGGWPGKGDAGNSEHPPYHS
ncbi:unnamed protein product, partial [Laminaria digitata]